MKLRTGASIPSVGFGTWEIKKAEIPAIITEAIKSGYRHIDCAAVYGNEDAIGATLEKMISEKTISRSELFITSKLWCTMMAPGKVEAALDKTLKDLRMDYLDLYLIHWPMCFDVDQNGCALKDSEGKTKLSGESIDEIWKVMQEMKAKGKARAIGVSNFTIQKLEALIKNTGIVPDVNQIELHPYLPQDDLIDYCRSEKILVEAYSPLGSGREPRIMADDVILTVAKEEGLSPAQTLISWALTRNTLPLVRTTKVERLKENISVKELSMESMRKIHSISKRHRYIDPLSWAGHDLFGKD